MCKWAHRWFLLSILLFYSIGAYAAEVHTDLHIFWAKGCPHCEKALAFLNPLPQTYPGLRIHSHEISGNQTQIDLLIRLAKQRQITEVGVPLIVLGNEALIGYQDDETTGEMLKSRIEACRKIACQTPLDELPVPSTIPVETSNPDQFNPRNLSLPMLTITLAAADGFNPCAMWVLVFLIGLLLGVESRPRRWLLGGTFIVASSLVYFLIMAAWLNTLLYLGAALWLRIAIAVLALFAGAGSIRASLRKEQVCTVTAAPARRAILERLRKLALSASLPLALVSISLLAFAVNIVELLCSAGIPAVYTQYLALNPLPLWQHYAYLGLYILVFMADDLLVFVSAMLALEMTGIGQRYTRWSKLAGGLILLVIGLLILLKPEWLM